MTAAVRDRASRTGVWVLCGAIAMCFAALTSAMVVRRSLGPDWSGIPVSGLLWANTGILALSSVAIEFHRARAALTLGALFLAGQMAVWRGIAIAASPGDSFFMVFTVTHAAHVAGGLGALALARPEMSRIYWHFLSGLWLYLMLLFSFWGNR